MKADIIRRVKLDEYTKANHEYHVYVNTVINLSRRIADIFESSKPHEKRAFLNYLLQNPTVNAKKLAFTMRSPFNLVLELANSPNWLRTVNNVRTIFERQNEYIYIPDLRSFANS